MGPRLAQRLTRLYPRGWRERYGEEFAALLEAQPCAARVWTDVLCSALGEHARSLGAAMKADREWSTVGRWCSRAPWVVFGLAPLMTLTGAYCVACFILWSGWEMFLPGSDTPFVPISGVAVLYFGVGRLLYYTAPVLVGWTIGLFATHLHANTVWPLAGLALLAAMGATAQVHVGRPLQGALGQVTLSFGLGPNLSASVLRALVILGLTAVPYLLWRAHQAHSFSD